jgi:hypothetical protein
MAMYYYATKLSVVACGIGCRRSVRKNNRKNNSQISKNKTNDANADDADDNYDTKDKEVSFNYLNGFFRSAFSIMIPLLVF